MKNIFKTFILLTLLCSTWACTSPNMFEEESILVDNEITKIEAVIEPFEIGESTNTRTTITLGEFGKIGTLVWAEGDTIGIYPSQGDQLSFPIVDGIGKTRCEFSGGGWALKGSTETTTYTYSAYSPFNRNYYFQKDNKALPVSMLGQKQIGNNNSSHLGAYDIQLAKGETPTSGTLVFEFKHQASYVRMDITAPCKANWKNITLESNATFTTKAAINLSEAIPTISPTLQSNSVSLELENVNTNDSLHIVAYMMMLPVDFTGKNLTMKLTDTDDNVYSAPVTFVNPINAANYLNFAANKARWISAEFEESTGTEDIPYITFTAESTQTFTMSQTVETLEYSVDGGEWKTLGTTIVPFGGEYGNLRIRGKSSIGTAISSTFWSSSQIKFGNITSVRCVGDIRTLIDYENYATVYTGDARFCMLFYGCTSLVSAPALPATTLASYCYNYMFSGCSSLTEAPVLPATSLKGYCYNSMFMDCTSLVSVPNLPATVLEKSCYDQMFAGCISITKAPALPATTLTESCYQAMFYGCSNLTEAPALPATTLASNCYVAMFSDCSSLTKAPVLPATTLASNCYTAMFSDCSSLTDAPALPATILAESCYYEMFFGCSSLAKVPKLPAMLLSSKCYYKMFSDCSSLTETPALPATILAESCYSGMFYGCSSLTEVPALPATTLAESCYYEMFFGCSSLTEAPALPATTLASNCYNRMFYNCSSLTEAPALPATILAESCYDNMFSNCSSLKEVTMLATDITAYNSLKDWLYGVSTTGTFIKSPEMDENSFEKGESGIPEGWTIKDYTTYAGGWNDEEELK